MSGENQTLTRRNFFAQLADITSNHLSSARGKESHRNPWVKIARFSEMTPGRISRFECEETRGVLYSNAIGVYAVLENTRRPVLRVTPHGCIEMHLIEEWRKEQLLSHMTGSVMSSAEGDARK